MISKFTDNSLMLGLKKETETSRRDNRWRRFYRKQMTRISNFIEHNYLDSSWDTWGITEMPVRNGTQTFPLEVSSETQQHTCVQNSLLFY